MFKIIFVFILCGFFHSAISQNDDTLYSNGINAISKGNWEAAYKYLSDFNKLNPDNAKGYNSLGVVLFQYQRYKPALDCFLKAIDLDTAYGNAYSGVGAVYLMLDDPDNCYKYISKSFAYNPDDMNAWNTLASYYAVKGDINEAMRTFEKALKINPECLDIIWSRGAVFLQLDNYDDALKDVNRAIEINPLIPKSFYFRGTVYRYKKDFNKALADFETALKLNPEEAEAYIRRGITYLDMGNYKKAVSDMEKGYGLNPELKTPTEKYYKEAVQKMK